MLQRVAIAAVSLLLVADSHAQDVPPATPPAKAPSSGFLAGPAVASEEQPATLVQRDFQGSLERTEERPELAALRLLKLDEAEQVAVDAQLTRRVALVSAAIRDHHGLFLKAQGARQGGGSAENRQTLGELRRAISPLLEPTFASLIEGALSEKNRAEFKRLLTEYHEALATAPDPQRPMQQGALRRDPAAAELRLTIREMARALSTVVDERRARFDAIVRVANATEEQQAAIAAALRKADAKPGAVASPEERAALMLEIMELLTPEQRQAVAAHLRGS